MKLSPGWLWADVHELDDWKKLCTTGEKGAELTSWAKRKVNESVERHLGALSERLRPGASFGAVSAEGKLTLTVDGVPVITAYPNSTPTELDFVAIQWRFLGRTQTITDQNSARQILDRFLSLKRTDNAAAITQLSQLDTQLSALDGKLARKESEIDDRISELFGLTPEERRLIEGR